MPRWRKGEHVIERLLEVRHLERTPADPDITGALRAAAARHIGSARACAGTDPEGSYALAYDAVRKAATALLAHQGLRPTSAGGHIAVVEAIEAQFPISLGCGLLSGRAAAGTRPNIPTRLAMTLWKSRRCSMPSRSASKPSSPSRN